MSFKALLKKPLYKGCWCWQTVLDDTCKIIELFISNYLWWKDANLMQDTSNPAFWDRKIPIWCRTHQIELFGKERCQSDAGHIKSNLLGWKDANLMQDTSNPAFWKRKMPIWCRTHQIKLFGIERCQSDAGHIKSSFLEKKDANLMQDTSNRERCQSDTGYIITWWKPLRG